MLFVAVGKSLNQVDMLPIFQAINSGFCKCERALNASVLCIYVYVCVHKSMSACESCLCEGVCMFVYV